MSEENNGLTADTAVNQGGPVPGSSAITVEDAPPVTTPEPQGEVTIVQEPEPEPARPPEPTPVAKAPIEHRTSEEQALGRAKVEQYEARERLKAASVSANESTPGGEEARIAASKQVNSEL